MTSLFSSLLRFILAKLSSLKAFHRADWVFLLAEIVITSVAVYAAYKLAGSGQLTDASLLTICSFLSAGVGFMWNKVYQRVRTEGYVSPASEILTVVGPIRAAVLFMIFNVVVYWYLLNSLKPISTNYFYASSLCFHLLIIGFVVYMITAKGESLRSLGCRIGKARVGALLTILPLLLFGTVLVRIYLLGGYAEFANLGSAAGPALALLFSVVITPISEEILFRGYIQREFQKTMGRIGSVFWGSIAFTIIHIPRVLLAPEFTSSPVHIPWLSVLPIPLSASSGSAASPIQIFDALQYLVVVFIVGIYCSWIYRESDSVIYPMAFHGVYNFVATVMRYVF